MPQVGVLLIVKHLTEKKSLDSFPFCSVLPLFTLLNTNSPLLPYLLHCTTEQYSATDWFLFTFRSERNNSFPFTRTYPIHFDAI